MGKVAYFYLHAPSPKLLAFFGVYTEICVEDFIVVRIVQYIAHFTKLCPFS
jgi:hypothetical protein